MTEKAFQSTSGGAPFPRSAKEWMEKGMPAEMAEHRMRQDVFGHDYQTDARGNPIERGKGSAAQPTQQHLQAVRIAEDAAAQRGMRQGWHPGLEGAFDPKVQDAIDRAVAAALKKAKASTPKRSRKAKAAPEVAN